MFFKILNHSSLPKEISSNCVNFMNFITNNRFVSLPYLLNENLDFYILRISNISFMFLYKNYLYTCLLQLLVLSKLQSNNSMLKKSSIYMLILFSNFIWSFLIYSSNIHIFMRLIMSSSSLT